MPDAAIVLARFLHYAAVLTLFGISLFPLYTYPAHAGAPPERVRRLLRSTALSATLAALLSGCFWFACVVAGMTGTPWGVFDRNALWPVLSETSFGAVSAARLLIAVGLLGLIATQTKFVTTSSLWLTVGFSAALLASLAGVGHTQIHEGLAGVVHLGADGLHLLAAGAWLGGLLPLLYLAATAVRMPSPDHQVEAANAALRFSGMGYGAVATIAGSGLLNGWFLVGSVAGLIATPYGQLLMLKLCLFAGMLALAAVNRFWLVPSLIKNKERTPSRQLFKLCAHVLGEQALGLLIILIVSAMGTMDPAINLQG